MKELAIPATDHWNGTQHFYDMPLLAYLGVIFDPARSVVDVGANVGHVTRFFAQRTRRKVTAIEASAVNFDALKSNVDDLDNVEVIRAAVGREGAATVSFLDNGTTLSHVDVSGRSANLVTVPVITLDALDATDVGLLKIDVEGYEMEVLSSARRFIEEHRPIVAIEVEDKWLKRFGASAKDVFRFFADLGYQKPVNKFGRRDETASDQIFAPRGTYLPRLYFAYGKEINRARSCALGSPITYETHPEIVSHFAYRANHADPISADEITCPSSFYLLPLDETERAIAPSGATFVQVDTDREDFYDIEAALVADGIALPSDEHVSKLITVRFLDDEAATNLRYELGELSDEEELRA